MSSWNGFVVTALASLMLAACGVSEDVVTADGLASHEAAARQEEPSPGFWPCGDGFCNSGEPTRCPEDCGYGGYCGDGICNGPETYPSCSDCSAGGGCLAAPREEPPTSGFWPCGDGFCNSGEPTRCPEDCGYGGYCGDGICNGPETYPSCSDCSAGGGCLAAPRE
jgi:hypothetical protein